MDATDHLHRRHTDIDAQIAQVDRQRHLAGAAIAVLAVVVLAIVTIGGIALLRSQSSTNTAQAETRTLLAVTQSLREDLTCRSGLSSDTDVALLSAISAILQGPTSPMSNATREALISQVDEALSRRQKTAQLCTSPPTSKG